MDRKQCDFDQLILEFWKEGEPNQWLDSCSYKDGSNRKQVLTYEAKDIQMDYLMLNGQVVKCKTRR
jgi:hypothetical protein